MVAGVKLSQIASGGAFVSATDSIVTVRNGNTDVLTKLPSPGSGSSGYEYTFYATPTPTAGQINFSSSAPTFTFDINVTDANGNSLADIFTYLPIGSWLQVYDPTSGAYVQAQTTGNGVSGGVFTTICSVFSASGTPQDGDSVFLTIIPGAIGGVNSLVWPTSSTAGYYYNDGSGNISINDPAISIVIGTTSIASGTTGRLLYDDGGVAGETAAGVYATSGNLFTFTAQTSTDIPLTLQGASGQSEALQEWDNAFSLPVILAGYNTGGGYSYFTMYGADGATAGKLTISAYDQGAVIATSGSGSSTLYLGTNGGADIEIFTAGSSRLLIGGGNGLAQGTNQLYGVLQIINQSSGNIPFYVVGASGQSVDLTQWINSSAVVGASISAAFNMDAVSYSVGGTAGATGALTDSLTGAAINVGGVAALVTNGIVHT